MLERSGYLAREVAGSQQRVERRNDLAQTTSNCLQRKQPTLPWQPGSRAIGTTMLRNIAYISHSGKGDGNSNSGDIPYPGHNA